MDVSPTEKPTAGGIVTHKNRLMHITGLALVPLALYHFGVMHLHLGVDTINFDLVAARFHVPFWQIFDSVLLLMAGVHGLVGSSKVASDYARAPAWKRAAVGLVWTVGGILLLLGVFTVLTFVGK